MNQLRSKAESLQDTHSVDGQQGQQMKGHQAGVAVNRVGWVYVSYSMCIQAGAYTVYL